MPERIGEAAAQLHLLTMWEDFEMMKKFAAMLLTGVMAISLAACGGSSGASTSTDNAAAEPAAEETAAADAAVTD